MFTPSNIENILYMPFDFVLRKNIVVISVVSIVFYSHIGNKNVNLQENKRI